MCRALLLVLSPRFGESANAATPFHPRDTVTSSKAVIHDFCEAASCGAQPYQGVSDRASFEEQSRIRYELEPYIVAFAQFSQSGGKRVLEIGLGCGAAHKRFAEAGPVFTESVSRSAL